jgi:hypothetical protein
MRCLIDNFIAANWLRSYSLIANDACRIKLSEEMKIVTLSPLINVIIVNVLQRLCPEPLSFRIRSAAMQDKISILWKSPKISDLFQDIRQNFEISKFLCDWSKNVWCSSQWLWIYLEWEIQKQKMQLQN